MFKQGLFKQGLFKQGLRYFLVGCVSAALDFGLFFLLFNVFGIDVRLSNVAAITLSAIFNFSLSRVWTFKSTSNVARSMILYLVLFVFNNLFSTVAIIWLIGLSIPSSVAKIMTMACITLWNFVLYRTVVFK
jgi:putative flippase GtrA